MTKKIFVLDGQKGYFLENEEDLCKLYCNMNGISYHVKEIIIPEPEEDNEKK